MADSTEVLGKKVDDLSSTINRLSKSFEDYIHQQQNQPPPQYNQKGGHDVTPTKAADSLQTDEFSQDFSKDENEERGNWTGRLDFLLACLGYAVGLGNVWRFPYLCYKNGGAVFFIPYVIMLTFVGMPIFFMELSLGQFTSSGPLTCWEMAKFFKGIGVAMVIVSGLVGIYYNMIIAWALFYLFASFTSELPWKNCDRDWASDFCEDYLLTNRQNNNFTAAQCMDAEFMLANARSEFLSFNEDFNNETVDSELFAGDDGVCYWLSGEKENLFGKQQNNTPIGIFNQTLASKDNLKPILATEEYLNGYVLGSSYSDGFDDLGYPRWQLVLCLLLAWVIVCLSLIKGVKSSGKVVYFTALFPYLVLCILFVRGLLLPGSGEGIDFYILSPDLDKLKEAQVWKDAAVQIFFSLSASWGGLIALSSYNRFHNDVLRDSLIVSCGNCLTSFFAGFVIFSFIGFLSDERGVPIDELAESGSTLAFVIYPAAVMEMPVSPLWAILFFIMLITLGLDSEFALIETVTTSFMDQFPSLRKRKALVIIGTGVVFFLLGLTMTCNGGIYLLQLMDDYSGGWNVLLIALCECICVAYVYGFSRYSNDIKIMIHGSCSAVGFANGCNMWWAVMWYFFTPAGVLFIMIFSWYDYSSPTLGNYEFPVGGEILGWLMTLFVVCGIVVTPIILMCMKWRKGEDITELFRPTRYWGPALPKHRRLMGRYLSQDKYEVDPWGDSAPVDMEQGDNGYTNPDFEPDKTAF